MSAGGGVKIETNQILTTGGLSVKHKCECYPYGLLGLLRVPSYLLFKKKYMCREREKRVVVVALIVASIPYPRYLPVCMFNVRAAQETLNT